MLRDDRARTLFENSAGGVKVVPELTLDCVTKMFGGHVAVDNLSLSVGDGEFVCLLGPSGCGKTTTLRLIAGFETVDRGAIRLDGFDITGVPPQQRDIGLVFQHYALFPHMTVAQNVGYGLKMRRFRAARIAKEVDATLDLVRLRHLASRYPNQLSGGQQQRVALARALAIRPRLLLMDEPLSSLDPNLRDDMRTEIRHIQRQVKITTVFVTHDQAEAFALADRIGVMTEGRLRQLADPTSIYETPTSAAVGTFIGKVNTVNGQITELDGERAVLDAGAALKILGVAHDVRLGTRATAIIRQERVLLSRDAGSADNVFKARIKSNIYLGGQISYVCELQSGAKQDPARSQDVVALVPNHPSLERFSAGDTVRVSWLSADCHIYPAERDTAEQASAGQP
jgi:putative spermidine/putrescine transport system ATP-binding protein